MQILKSSKLQGYLRLFKQGFLSKSFIWSSEHRQIRNLQNKKEFKKYIWLKIQGEKLKGAKTKTKKNFSYITFPLSNQTGIEVNI